jgi:peptide/nickel transport system substrate-binding protein
MRRRQFLKATAAATGVAITAPYIRPARAQGRNNTLLALSESGPNNLDIMGLGTNRPGYEASWNTHDRLVAFGAKPDRNGVDHYDYTKIEPELAESWDVTDTSATFKLRAGAKFHDGTPVTSHDVKWSFDRGHGRRLPNLPNESRLARKARAVRRRRRPYLPHRLPAQG